MNKIPNDTNTPHDRGIDPPDGQQPAQPQVSDSESSEDEMFEHAYIAELRGRATATLVCLDMLRMFQQSKYDRGNHAEMFEPLAEALRLRTQGIVSFVLSRDPPPGEEQEFW